MPKLKIDKGILQPNKENYVIFYGDSLENMLCRLKKEWRREWRKERKKK